MFALLHRRKEIAILKIPQFKATVDVILNY